MELLRTPPIAWVEVLPPDVSACRLGSFTTLNKMDGPPLPLRRPTQSLYAGLPCRAVLLAGQRASW